MTELPKPYFQLAGQFDPDQITALLGRQPTYVARVGDPGLSGAIRPRAGAIWRMEAGDDCGEDNVADQLAYLIGVLYEQADQVADLSSQHRGKFCVFHLAGENRLSWFMANDLLRKIARLKVNIECTTLQAKGEPE